MWLKAASLVFTKYYYAVIKNLVWNKRAESHIPDLSAANRFSENDLVSEPQCPLKRGGRLKEKMSQGSSLVASTPRLPQCYLQRVAYKEPVMKHSHMGSLPLIPRGKGYFSLCLPVFCCWPAHSLLALGLQRRFGCLPGFEEDSPLRDCVTDTEMLMRARLS